MQLSTIKLKLGNQKEAIQCLDLAISICKKCDLKPLESQVWQEKGSLQLMANNYNDALSHFKQSLTYPQATLAIRIQVQINCAQCEEQLKQFTDSIQSYAEVVKLCRTVVNQL